MRIAVTAEKQFPSSELKKILDLYSLGDAVPIIKPTIYDKVASVSFDVYDGVSIEWSMTNGDTYSMEREDGAWGEIEIVQAN